VAVRTGLVVKRIALSLLGTGSLLLGFVAYQLWGTALYEHSAQARLQQELRSKLHTMGTLPPLPKVTATSGQTFQNSRVAPTVPDPGTGSAVGLISIPAIGVSGAAIIEGTGESQLQQGPGHYPGTPLPGEAGNAAIAGHRTTYGAPFYNLDQVKTGDAINIQTPQGLFGYQVVLTKIVSPDDVSVLQPSALPELTLTTCNPRYSATSRLIVTALLRTSVTANSFVNTTTPPGATSTTTTSAPASGAPAQIVADEAGSDVGGGVIGAILWGLGAVAAAIAGSYAYRRLTGAARWSGAVGWLGAVALLLPCFQHISLALPASF